MLPGKDMDTSYKYCTSCITDDPQAAEEEQDRERLKYREKKRKKKCGIDGTSKREEKACVIADRVAVRRRSRRSPCTHVVEDAGMAVHGGGHGRGTPVRVLQVEERRSAVHRLENVSGSGAGGQHRSRLAGVLCVCVFSCGGVCVEVGRGGEGCVVLRQAMIRRWVCSGGKKKKKRVKRRNKMVTGKKK